LIKAAHRHAANMVAQKFPSLGKANSHGTLWGSPAKLTAVHNGWSGRTLYPGGARVGRLGRVFETSLETVLGTVLAAR
jgi:hypothetical protein